MVFFAVEALFTNVPLEYSINLVLKQIYENYEILTSITNSKMRDRVFYYVRKMYILRLEMLFLYQLIDSLWVLLWDLYWLE